MPAEKQIFQNQVGPEEEDRIWQLYEACGSAAEVARAVDLPSYAIRNIINRDPLRKAAVLSTRAESVAARWEAMQSKTAECSEMLVDVVMAMLKHIRECAKNGQDTDLRDMQGMDSESGSRRLSPTEAYQWMLKTRALDMLQKLGLTAAKIGEGMRVIYRDEMGARKEGEQGPMSTEDLRDMAKQIKDAGLPVPWAIQHHLEGHGSDKSSP